MSRRTDCPFILHTQTGKEIAESFMKEMGMNINSEEDRMSFYATFSAWQNNNEDKDFPDSTKELKAFDCRVPTESIPQSYEGMITPDENTIFVFGSNPEGRHGAGAAKVAVNQFGAIYGQGEGLQGNAYALPTKDLRVRKNRSLKSISPAQITENIRRMYEVARQNPSKQFKVAYTNKPNETTLNGYTGREMIDMFKVAGPIPSNVIFSKNWAEQWYETQGQSTKSTDSNQLSLFDDTSFLDAVQKADETFGEALLKDMAKSRKTREMLKELQSSQIHSFAKIIAQYYSSTISANITALKNTPFGQIFTGDMMLDRKILVTKFGEQYTPKALLNNIKQQLQNKYGTKEAIVESLKSNKEFANLSNEQFNEKVNNIFNNAQQLIRHFDSIVPYSAIFIKTTEPISILNEANEVVNTYEEDLLSEEFVTREHWQIEQLEQSAWSTLDPAIKNIVNQIDDIDNKGNHVLNELGESSLKDAKTVHATILSIVSKVTDCGQMVPELFNNISNYPWLQQVCDILCGKNTENITLYDESNIEQTKILAQNIQALFWKDFHKPFITMATIDINNDNAILNILNELQHSEDLYEDIANNIFEQKPVDRAIYKIGGTLNQRNYLSLLKEIQNDEQIEVFFSSLDIKDVQKHKEQYAKIYNILQKLGVNIEKKDLTTFFKIASKSDITAFKNIIFNGFFNQNVENNAAYQGLLKNKNQAVFSAFNNNYKQLARLLSFGKEVTHENSVTITLDNKSKTLFSNTYPSLILDLIANFKQPKDQVRQFIEREYLYDFHFNKKIGNKLTIPNVWLRELYEGNMKHSDMFNIINLLGSNGKTYMSEDEAEAQITNLLAYFIKKSPITGGYSYTYYPVGTFADAKSSYYIRNKVRSLDECLDNMVDMVIMEIDHIKYVQAKKKAIERTQYDAKQRRSAIEHFDEKENLPSLPEVDSKSFIENLNNYKTNSSKKNFIKEVLSTILEKRFNEFVSDLEKNRIIEQSSALSKVLKNNQEALLREYFYNTTLANTCMDNMFIVDYTMFKNADMKQKRFKMLYSPYSTAYTHCYLYENGKPVDQSLALRKDDKGRYVEFSVLLADRITTSPSFNQVEDTFKNLFKEGIINQQQYNLIVNNIKKINVGDGQCYRNPKSYERLINMLGQGQNQSVRKALDLIRQSYTDPNTALSQGYWEAVFNVLKPLVAGYEEVDTGITAEDLGVSEAEAERYAKVKVPVMHKNSEFLLMAIYPVIQGITTQSPKLRAINKFMEDYDIDKVQFESASKIGNHGIININDEKKVYIEDDKIYNIDNKELTPSEDDIYYDINSDKYFAWSEEDGLYEMDYEDWIYETLVRSCGLYNYEQNEPEPPRQIQFNDGYNNNFIHAVPLERYGIISNVPEHLLEHTKSNLGTQFIKIAEEDAVTHDKNGNPILLDVRINNNNVKLTVEQVHELFQDVLVDYVQKAFTELDETFNNPVKLKAFILQEMSKQTVYNENLEDCLRIDPLTKKFDISLLNPIRANAFISFCASLIRKEMIQHRAKQGLLPQVSAFGLEDNLQLRYFTQEFTDKNGNTKRTLVFTSKEWVGIDKVDNNYENDLKALKSRFKTYREYINSEFGKGVSVAYMEVATPIYDNLFKHFIDSETGMFNVEAFEKAVSPDVRYALGYRIPTEAKHSMIPLRIKHFLPYQNASCVTMAIDWVFLSGSDFDIDKLFTILPELTAIDNTKEAIDNIINQLNITEAKDKRLVKQIVQHIAFGKAIPNNILISDFYKKVNSLVNNNDLFKINPVQFESKSNSFEDLKNAIKDNSRAANNNLFLNLATALLQSENNMKHILTPNSIEHVKATSTIIKILSNPANKFTTEGLRTLLDTRDDEILNKNYNVESNTLAPNDPRLRSIEHYKNMTGLNLTALFAVFRAFLPVVQKTNMKTRDTFILNGNISVKNNNQSLTNRRNAITDDYISDLIGEYIAAAVDNAKDPRLAYLYFNLVTAPYAVFLTLRGYTTTEIALLLNQPIIKYVINTYITNNKTTSLNRICEDLNNNLDEQLSDKNFNVSDAAYTSLSDSKLAQSIMLDAKGIDFNEEGNEKLLAFQKIVLTEFMKLIPVVSEFNNYSGICRNSTVANAVPSDTAYLIKKLDDYWNLVNKQSSSTKQINGAQSITASSNQNPADKFEAELRDTGLLNIDKLLSKVDFKTTSLFQKINKRYVNLLGNINIKENDINNLSTVAQNYIFSNYLTPSKNTKSAFDTLRKIIKAETGLETADNNNYTGRILLLFGVPMLVNRLKASRQLTSKGDILSYINRYYDQNSGTSAIGVWGKNRSKDTTTQMSIAWSSLYQKNDNYEITVGTDKININSKDLADILWLYNIVKGGITPSYQNFMQAYPNGQELEIPEFKERVNNMDNDVVPQDELDKIVEQYIQNYPLSASGVKVIIPKLFASLTGQNEENGQIKLDFIPDIIIVRNRTALNKLKVNNTDYCKYFSTVLNGTTVLYKSNEKGAWERIPVLGNNGTYLEVGKDVNESVLMINNVANISEQTVDELNKKFDLVKNGSEDYYIQDAIQSEANVFNNLQDKIITNLSTALSNSEVDVATIVYNDEQEVQDTDKTGMKICSIKR